jgi:hypothetical protein
MLFSLAFTVFGCFFGAFIGRKLKHAGHGATDELVKEHAEYSEMHRQFIKRKEESTVKID